MQKQLSCVPNTHSRFFQCSQVCYKEVFTSITKVKKTISFVQQYITFLRFMESKFTYHKTETIQSPREIGYSLNNPTLLGIQEYPNGRYMKKG